MDGWFLGSFVHRAFKQLATSGEHALSQKLPATAQPERDLIAR
jgi:hypothetical protein